MKPSIFILLSGALFVGTGFAPVSAKSGIFIAACLFAAAGATWAVFNDMRGNYD